METSNETMSSAPLAELDTYGRSMAIFLSSLGLTVAADQITKFLIVSELERGQIVEVIPKFFNLTLAFNKGAAFGFLASAPEGTRQLALAFTTILALSVVVYFLVRDFRGRGLSRHALALILGGAVGNVIDRVRLGEVIDFLDVYWGAYHWPAFNIADSAICIGVFLLLIAKPGPALGSTK